MSPSSHRHRPLSRRRLNRLVRSLLLLPPCHGRLGRGTGAVSGCRVDHRPPRRWSRTEVDASHPTTTRALPPPPPQASYDPTDRGSRPVARNFRRRLRICDVSSRKRAADRRKRQTISKGIYNGTRIAQTHLGEIVEPNTAIFTIPRFFHLLAPRKTSCRLGPKSIRALTLPQDVRALSYRHVISSPPGRGSSFECAVREDLLMQTFVEQSSSTSTPSDTESTAHPVEMCGERSGAVDMRRNDHTVSRCCDVFPVLPLRSGSDALPRANGRPADIMQGCCTPQGVVLG